MFTEGGSLHVRAVYAQATLWVVYTCTTAAQASRWRVWRQTRWRHLYARVVCHRTVDTCGLHLGMDSCSGGARHVSAGITRLSLHTLAVLLVLFHIACAVDWWYACCLFAAGLST